MVNRSILPNLLTGTRLALLPVLWILAATGYTRLLAVGVAVAVSTDILDGTLARALDARSELGSRLDSIADHLLSGSFLIWLVWLRPEFVIRHWLEIVTWVVFGAITLLVGWVRFRRIGDLHLYSAKAAMTAGYLFGISLLFFGGYDRRVFALVIGILYLATAESLLVYLTRHDPDERIGSILLRGRR
jgi:phosphatidylglycerophosphate synthase